MIHLNSQEFFERIDSLLRKFKPNNEAFEAIRKKENIQMDSDRFKDMDLIILGEQEPGTILLAKGISREYTLRINKGSVDVWQNQRTNGLRGPQECIVSFLEHGKHESYDLEEGIMRKTSGSGMPLVIHDITQPREHSILKPTGTWLDKYEHIYVWQKE